MAARVKKKKRKVHAKKVITTIVPSFVDTTVDQLSPTISPAQVEESLAPLELREALFYIDDILDRCLTDYFVLGQLARDLHDGMELSGNKIQLGILTRDFTKYTRDTIEALFPELVITETSVKTTFRGIPVEISLISGDYPYFKHPDFRHYYVNSFYIANPFEDYWQVHTQFEL